MVDSTGMRTDNIKPGTPITSETSSSKNTNDSSSGNAKNSSTAVEKIVPSRQYYNIIYHLLCVQFCFIPSVFQTPNAQAVMIYFFRLPLQKIFQRCFWLIIRVWEIYNFLTNKNIFWQFQFCNISTARTPAIIIFINIANILVSFV